jgi:hypothetical protein
MSWVLVPSMQEVPLKNSTIGLPNATIRARGAQMFGGHSMDMMNEIGETEPPGGRSVPALP